MPDQISRPAPGAPTRAALRITTDPAAAALVADVLAGHTFRGQWLGDRPVLAVDAAAGRSVTVTRAGLRRAVRRDVPARVLTEAVRVLRAFCREVQDEIDVIALARAVDLGCAAADVATAAPAGAR